MRVLLEPDAGEVITRAVDDAIAFAALVSRPVVLLFNNVPLKVGDRDDMLEDYRQAMLVPPDAKEEIV